MAREKRGQFVVLDGREGRRYRTVDEFSLVFSPDNRRLAYVAGRLEGKWFTLGGIYEFVVVDGQENGVIVAGYSGYGEKNT